MKRIKMLIYGEPGVGKSVFASKFPKPFFVTTDGNYEWLIDFGANPDAYQQVSSWSEAKEVFSRNFDDYDTIVVDLLEDLFKWCEYEYCTRNKIEHISDIGYAKGYDSTRTEFFIEICKLLALDKNIVMIMHGVSFETKDRRGVSHLKHAPSSRLPDKVLDMIEGRVRYCLRCYLKDEEQADGTLLKKRFLSLVPKPNEFGICRGIDENKVPHDIDLSFEEFAKCINYSVEESAKVKQEFTKVKEKVVKAKEKVKPSEELVQEEIPFDVDEAPVLTGNDTSTEIEEKTSTVEQPKEEVKNEVKEEVKETKPEVNKEVKTELSNNDKLAAIRAKLAAINAKK